MTKIAWDGAGTRKYETGVDHGVLYIPNNLGAYTNGYPWNGLVSVGEKPSGAEPTPLYADNIKYLNLISAEEFMATIEAFTYPMEFEQCDGTATLANGVTIGQQNRRVFGLSYRTLVGNDLVGTDYGYKLKLVYGALAAPTEKTNATVNEAPEAQTLSWEISTTKVDVPGFKPTAIVTIDSTITSPAKMLELETILYGAPGVDPRLPTPAEVATIVGVTIVTAQPTAPTYNATTKVIGIPVVLGVVYKIDGVIRTGNVTITTNTVVTAEAIAGYRLPTPTDDDWFYSFV